ncbi:MAG: 16S rRNA (guanine(966)-N(2))-methyltransferase RsmD [Betaproteobacteria bacterium]|nr:16S rRNA (guanine(966)-N(2))-methyltransferase RsmD [Betaproteobacteria bacterium]
MNRVRIIGGAWRRRYLAFPDLPDLRPTPDRVRETLFNWLGQDLAGKACLDLFAGSGALGFEALSRGARQVVMVESDRKVMKALRDNAQRLAAANLELILADGVKFAASDHRAYDVVFLDPPFRAGLLPELFELMPQRLAPGGLLYVESGVAPAPGPGWRVVRGDRAGKVHYQLLEWNDHVQQGDLPRNV